MSEIKKPERRSPLSRGKAKHDSSSIRERILQAAFTLFRERGFSTLDSNGHEANRKALTDLVRKAQARGLVQASKLRRVDRSSRQRIQDLSDFRDQAGAGFVLFVVLSG